MTLDNAVNNPAPFGAAKPASEGYLGLIDGILRRREDYFSEIFQGEKLRQRIRSYLTIIAVLSLVYGLTMGTSAL